MIALEPMNTSHPVTLVQVVYSTHREKEKSRQETQQTAYLVDEEYLVTALVPSDTACLASSPGRIRRTLRKELATSGS